MRWKQLAKSFQDVNQAEDYLFSVYLEFSNKHIMRLPFSAYLLNDEWTLVAYEHGELTSMADILRRLYMLGKAKDVYQPDYCFEGSFEEEMRELGCNDKCSLSQLIVKSLKYLAKRYLMYLKGNLYVKKDMLDEWMEVVRVFPPLLIESAFFWMIRSLKGWV